MLPHKNVVVSAVIGAVILVVLLVVGSWVWAGLRIIGPFGTFVIGILVGHYLWRHTPPPMSGPPGPNPR